MWKQCAVGHVNGKSDVPFSSGFMFQMAIGPRLANWPQHSSMKNSGMPITMSIITKGMRNAPGTTTMGNILLFDREYRDCHKNDANALEAALVLRQYKKTYVAYGLSSKFVACIVALHDTSHLYAVGNSNSDST